MFVDRCGKMKHLQVTADGPQTLHLYEEAWFDVIGQYLSPVTVTEAAFVLPHCAAEAVSKHTPASFSFHPSAAQTGATSLDLLQKRMFRKRSVMLRCVLGVVMWRCETWLLSVFTAGVRR